MPRGIAFVCLIAFFSVAARAEHVPVWDPQLVYPSAGELSEPTGIEHKVIHSGQETYLFLHEPALAKHGDSLFAAWNNSPLSESQRGTVIRWIRSDDGFRTWSEPAEVAPALKHETTIWESVQLLSVVDQLWAFVGQVKPQPRDRSNSGGSMVVFRFEQDTATWSKQGRVDGFHPLNPPTRSSEGWWIMGGQFNLNQPRVALSRGDDLTKWDVVEIPVNSNNAINYAETSIIVGRSDVCAFVRNVGRTLLTSCSRDGGKSWESLRPSNLPASSSKTCAGTFSTGQRYLAFSMVPSSDQMRPRDVLAIAVSAPGGEYFTKIIPIRTDTPPDPQVAEYPKGRGWAYPSVVEHEGRVYVAYSATKERCCLSIVPLDALRVDP